LGEGWRADQGHHEAAGLARHVFEGELAAGLAAAYFAATFFFTGWTVQQLAAVRGELIGLRGDLERASDLDVMFDSLAGGRAQGSSPEPRHE
jgi:hypothetical protein